MSTLKVALPQEVYNALCEEAARSGVSIDTVASVFLCTAVTHTRQQQQPASGTGK